MICNTAQELLTAPKVDTRMVLHNCKSHEVPVGWALLDVGSLMRQDDVRALNIITGKVLPASLRAQLSSTKFSALDLDIVRKVDPANYGGLEPNIIYADDSFDAASHRWHMRNGVASIWIPAGPTPTPTPTSAPPPASRITYNHTNVAGAMLPTAAQVWAPSQIQAIAQQMTPMQCKALTREQLLIIDPMTEEYETKTVTFTQAGMEFEMLIPYGWALLRPGTTWVESDVLWFNWTSDLLNLRETPYHDPKVRAARKLPGEKMRQYNVLREAPNGEDFFGPDEIENPSQVEAKTQTTSEHEQNIKDQMRFFFGARPTPPEIQALAAPKAIDCWPDADWDC